MHVAMLGCGKMGGAMAHTWLGRPELVNRLSIIKPSAPPDHVLRDSRVTWFESLGAFSHEVGPDVLVLAIKPQMMAELVPQCLSITGDDTVVISLAAGKTLASLTGWLTASGRRTPPIIRSMPNTPSSIGQGVTVAVASAGISVPQRDRGQKLFEAVGKIFWLDDEELMDAVTAISGSGPAYVFLLMEAMAAAGVALGVPPSLALALARATVQGAGNLAMVTPHQDPTILRQNVTSPGGTTAAALDILMAQGAIPDLFRQAFVAARDRARVLAQS